MSRVLTPKLTVIHKSTEMDKPDSFKIYWMTENEFTRIIVGKDASNSEYVISDGIIEPNGFVPDHYHKWEDQTFHVIEGELEAKVGETTYLLNVGDSIHCPKGVSHYIRNLGKTNAKLISYIFPGNWAEDFFAESSRQTKTGVFDLKLIEDKFGVVYLK